MVNPFRAVGCAKGLAEPRVNATVILASSELPDEGARIGGGTYLAKPGSYRVGGLKIEGFATPHDRVGGRRFGQATAWRWQQAGLNFAHLGGTAATLSGEDKVLLGRPDVLIIGVGGGGKVYNGEEAAKVVRALNPRRVIPVQYVNGEPPSGCDLGDAQPFLDAMAGTEVRKVGPNLNLPGTLGDNTVIEVMR
jgi:L-ascorbate metabolism protein UlaG (beta-lactamase superfamily)